MGKCECEHDNHFFDSPLTVGPHPYGDERETYPVKTDYGTFNVCKECSDTCLAKYKHNARQYRQ